MASLLVRVIPSAKEKVNNREDDYYQKYGGNRFGTGKDRERQK